MTNETLIHENIKCDMLGIEKVIYDKETELDISITIYIILAAIIIGGIFAKIWVGLVASLPSLIFIMRIIIKKRHSNHRKREIEKLNFDIQVEKLVEISEETIFEPHAGSKMFHATREAVFFYFENGRWRVMLGGDKFYGWSKIYDMRYTTLEMTSLKGDEFYVVRDPIDKKIYHAYNKKLFELKDGI